MTPVHLVFPARTASLVLLELMECLEREDFEEWLVPLGLLDPQDRKVREVAPVCQEHKVNPEPQDPLGKRGTKVHPEEMELMDNQESPDP